VPEGGVSAGIIFLLQNRGKITAAFFSVLLNFFRVQNTKRNG